MPNEQTRHALLFCTYFIKRFHKLPIEWELHRTMWICFNYSLYLWSFLQKIRNEDQVDMNCMRIFASLKCLLFLPKLTSQHKIRLVDYTYAHRFTQQILMLLDLNMSHRQEHIYTYRQEVA